MKQWIIFLGFALLFCSSITAQNRILIDKVIAVVGDRSVLLSDIEEQYKYLSAQGGEVPPNAKCLLLDQALTQKILLVQADLDSITVSEEEIETQLDARFDEILLYMGSREAFEEYYGETVEQARARFRNDLEDQILLQRMQSNIMGSVTITPAEVKEFFNNIPKDSLPYFNAEVQVGEIVIMPKPNKEQEKEAFDKLTEIRRQVIEGEIDFGETAKKISADRGSALKGGELGLMARGTLVPEYEAAAYNLDKNEYSPIIRSEFGYHLIQLIERRGNLINTRHILIKPEITSDDLENAKQELYKIRKDLLADSIPFIKAVKQYSSDDVRSKNNAGYILNPKTGDSYFEVSELSTDVYFVMDTMEINSISEPFEYQQPTGEVGYRIIKLISQSEPHKANLKDDYTKIYKAALEAKKATYMSEWLQEKGAKTYIKIDEKMYGHCGLAQKWLDLK